MASAIATTLSTMASGLMASGVFEKVAMVEPDRPPDKGISAAIYFVSAQPIGEASGADRGSCLYVFTVTLYKNALSEKAEDIDTDLLAVVDKVFDVLAGDFSLGATVRNIDFFGAQSQGLVADARYYDPSSGGSFRAIDITVPVIVNDSMVVFTA